MPESDVVVVRVEPGSELDRALAEAGDRDVILVRNGTSYRVRLAVGAEFVTRRVTEPADEDDDPWAGYDADALMKALHETAGVLSDEEAERMKEEIYRAREEGSRPTKDQ